ncbi:hypothetical protein C8R45DRAFT_1102333 [Mycena sanguinolenta]|nr:hypothetical protein C8R45DRAFT_1102333 [Mycena sanguinolenta]
MKNGIQQEIPVRGGERDEMMAMAAASDELAYRSDELSQRPDELAWSLAQAGTSDDLSFAYF